MTWDDIVAASVVFLGLGVGVYVLPFASGFVWVRFRAWYSDTPNID
jgi:hypothetical protein